MRNLLGVVFVLLGFSLNSMASEKRLPRSWYLELSHERVSRIKGLLRGNPFETLRLPAGLYLQDHDGLWARPEIQPGHLISEVRFELPGLSGSSYMGLVYPPGKSTEPELWLILPTRQRFKLAVHQGSHWDHFRFLPQPASETHWTPIKGGVLWFNRSWHPFLRHHKDLLQPELAPQSQSSDGTALLATSPKFPQGVQPRVATRTFQKDPEPLMVYRVESNRLLMLTCPGAGRVDPRELETCESMQPVLFNLDTGKGSAAGDPIAWPLALGDEGIYYTEDRDLQFARVLWETDSLAPAQTIRKMPDGEEFLSYGYKFYIQRYNASGTRKQRYLLGKDNVLVREAGRTRRYRSVGTIDDAAMEIFKTDGGLSRSVDILPGISTGARVPKYASDQVARHLTRSLGKSQRTFAVLVHEEGQLPEEVFSDFIWKVTTESVPLPDSLKNLERVYQLHSDSFDFDDREEVTDRLQVLLRAIHGNRAVAYLEQFPSPEPFRVSRGNGETLFADFWTYFQNALKDGSARVVISMRSDVYRALNTQFRGVFEYADIIRLPSMSRDEKTHLVASHRATLERARGRRFNQDGYQVFLNFVLSSGFKSRLESPKREMVALENLFDYLSTFHPHSSEIDRRAVQDWVNHQSGQDTFRSRLQPDQVCKQLRNDVVSHDDIIESICVALQAIKQGQRIYLNGPLAKFIFLGPTGTGKTFIPERLAELISGPGSILKIDMSEFSRISKTSPIYRQLKEAENQIRIVLFDDVDQIQDNKLAIDRLAGVMDTGIYGEGTEVELDFSNTMVFWTANWGEDVINSGSVSDTDLVTEIGLALTRGKDGEDAVLKPRIWGRIESAIYPFRSFTMPQLLELGIVLSRNRVELIRAKNSKDVRVDPRLIMEIVSHEKGARAGARSIKSRLENDVFSSASFVRALVNPKVTRLGLLQNVDALAASPFEILTNESPDFDLFWNDADLLPDLKGWSEAEDQQFVCDFLKDSLGMPGVQVSRQEYQKYANQYCKGGQP